MFIVASVVVALAGCAALQDAPRLAYRCPHGPNFEVRLYRDVAVIEGQRGMARLERGPDTDSGGLRYGDVSLMAEFGLGLDGRLAALRYTNIPDVITCERADTDDQAAAAQGPRPAAGTVPPGTRTAEPPPARRAPVQAAPIDGPRPGFINPNAPPSTNIRFGDGNNGPG